MVHFDANEKLDALETHAKGEQEGLKGRGAYVYQTSDSQSIEPGIYLRSEAGHETLTHEAIHWAEDRKIITQEEVRQYGGREGIAKAYVEWFKGGRKEPNTVFEKIWNAIEGLLGVRRAAFGEIEQRTQKPAEQPAQKAAWHGDAVSAVKGLNYGNMVSLPDLFKQLQAKHPGLTLEEFKREIQALNESGQIKLEMYTRAPAEIMEGDKLREEAIENRIKGEPPYWYLPQLSLMDLQKYHLMFVGQYHF
jgi:hypothetical protein